MEIPGEKSGERTKRLAKEFYAKEDEVRRQEIAAWKPPRPNPLFSLPEDRAEKLFTWLRECPYHDAVKAMLAEQGIADVTDEELEAFFESEANAHWERRLSRAATEANALVTYAAVGLLVWLEVDFASDGATVTTASIGSGSGGWSGFPTPFAYTGDSPDQVLASAFVLIGYIVAASSTLDGTAISGGPGTSPTTAKVVQCVTQHLLLRAGVFNGQAMIFPFPHHGPEHA
jgi:hypothetical protein